MKKPLAILISSLFLFLTFSQVGLADSQSVGVSKDLTLSQQWEKSPSLSAFLLFDEKDFALVHFPFTRTARTIAFQDLTTFFPLVTAILSARDLLWMEISKWNPAPSFSGIEHYEALGNTFRQAPGAKRPSTEERMAISLHHGVDSRKAWKVSLDLGIAIRNDYTAEPGDAVSDGLFPKLGMNVGDHGKDLLDQIRNAAPFIEVGISCRF